MLTTMYIDSQGLQYWSVRHDFRGEKQDSVLDASKCMQPNALGLEDGTRYNLLAMNDEQVKEILALTDATIATDMPVCFGNLTM